MLQWITARWTVVMITVAQRLSTTVTRQCHQALNKHILTFFIWKFRTCNSTATLSCCKIIIQYTICIRHYRVMDNMATLGCVYSTTFRLHSSGLAVIIQWSDIHKCCSPCSHLQQPDDTGALSRLRSTPCERGAVDAPGSVFGNFFAKHNQTLKTWLSQ